MMGKKIKQINGLIIRYTEIYKYAVWTADGRCLEDNLTYEQAVEFCIETTDFVERSHIRLFAASGSCFAKTKYIMGKVENGITFKSPEFTGTMDSQEFWDKLAAYAKSINRYVQLMY